MLLILLCFKPYVYGFCVSPTPITSIKLREELIVKGETFYDRGFGCNHLLGDEGNDIKKTRWICGPEENAAGKGVYNEN